MSRSVIQLSLEGGSVRGVRLVENGAELSRSDESSWGISAPAVPDLADAPIPGEESAPVADDGLERLTQALVSARRTFKCPDISLSVPLSKLLVKVIRIPVGQRENLDEAVAEHMEKLSPFPDESLAVGTEIVRETESDIFVAVAALPDAMSSEVGQALKAAKMHVVRTDATALGWMHSLWGDIIAKPDVSRRLVLLDLDGAGWDLLVMDDDAPVVMRGLGVIDIASLEREVTLSLMEAEISAGARLVGDVAVFTRQSPDADTMAMLGTFGDARVVEVADEFGGVDGAARRCLEEAPLDVTPIPWSQELHDSRFFRKLNLGLAISGGIWLLIMAVMFGGPMCYDYLKGREQAASAKIDRNYKHVKDVKSRVKVIKRYSNRSRSAVELLRDISMRLPDGVTLTAFDYERVIDPKGSALDTPSFALKISAKADNYQMQYEFKDELEASPFFDTISMKGSRSQAGVQQFTIEATSTIKEEGE